MGSGTISSQRGLECSVKGFGLHRQWGAMDSVLSVFNRGICVSGYLMNAHSKSLWKELQVHTFMTKTLIEMTDEGWHPACAMWKSTATVLTH